jgi:zinc/manganese transport system substrate-binding protein
VVVENGLGYDDFADRAIGTLANPPAVVRAGDVLGLQVGANPHVWYSAGYVDRVRSAIVDRLKQADPDASAYYDAQAAVLDRAFGTYRQLIGQIADQYSGVPVAATESIFVDMAYTTGLQLLSPPEFMQAIAEGNEPSARDIAEFQDQLRNRQVRVLVYNVQTVTPITEQLKSMARDADIPIVGVSETMPVGAQTFQGWQASQLRLLLNALQRPAAQ